MNQRTLLIIATGLTAFVLTVVGAVAAGFMPITGPIATAPGDPTPTPNLSSETAYQQRLTEYQAALVEANRRLELANQELARQQATPQATSENYAVSPKQAEAIALGVASGASLTKAAELVLYQGVPAYEIVFEQGTIYIDAQSRGVLANGIASGTITAEQAAQVAIAYRGGGRVREVELKQERGMAILEVKFTDGGEVYVDPATGQVVYADLGDYAGSAHEPHEGDD